jgi:NAD+ kinase
MNSRNLKIALLGNLYQTRKNASVVEVLYQLKKSDVRIVIEKEFATFIRTQLMVDTSTFEIASHEDIHADYAISMGGDGTFLNTAASIGNRNIPILGINTGRLGFFADVSPDFITPAIQMLLNGECKIEQRTLIAAEKDGKPFQIYPYALNEVAVLKHDNSSLIEVKTCVNGEPMANYMADGIIVCTPTGSTGYSLSVGGPIIEPRSGTFCISAVAPHSLSARPVILCDDAVITLTVFSRSHHFLISIDGRSESFVDQTTITLRRAPHTIGVVKVKHHGFFDTFRDKMMWGVDHRF